MIGGKLRFLAPLAAVSLEDLVPADHFYRHLERTLDCAGQVPVNVPAPTSQTMPPVIAV